MRLSKEKREELKALAEKGHPREYIDSAVLALPDALADIEELALYRAKPVKRGRWFSPIERQVKDA